ncbi:MAG: DUF4124 domain-containing protein [Pseudomonadales bacterium]|nr:DUF4124 domain-containing protein [Pseudomonadales bacterium]
MRGETMTGVRGRTAQSDRHWIRTLGPLLLAAVAGTAQGAEVVRWVDSKGVTHFGDPQLAPLHADAVPVDIAPANGMVPAVAPGVSSNGEGLRVVTLKLEGKRNKKGWRDGRTSLYTGRRHRSHGYR